MNGPTHKIGGIASGLVVARTMYGAGTIVTLTNASGLLEPSVKLQSISMFCVIGGVIGSLWMDIDKINTTASNKFPILSFFVRLFTKHRGMTHIPLVNVFLSYLLLWGSITLTHFINVQNNCNIYLLKLWDYISFGFTQISNGHSVLECMYPLWYGFLGGAISHILLDFITPEGVPILWPIIKEKKSIGKLNGKKHGPIVSTIIIASTLVCLYFNIL